MGLSYSLPGWVGINHRDSHTYSSNTVGHLARHWPERGTGLSQGQCIVGVLVTSLIMGNRLKFGLPFVAPRQCPHNTDLLFAASGMWQECREWKSGFWG